MARLLECLIAVTLATPVAGAQSPATKPEPSCDVHEDGDSFVSDCDGLHLTASSLKEVPDDAATEIILRDAASKYPAALTREYGHMNAAIMSVSTLQVMDEHRKDVAVLVVAKAAGAIAILSRCESLTPNPVDLTECLKRMRAVTSPAVTKARDAMFAAMRRRVPHAWPNPVAPGQAADPIEGCELSGADRIGQCPAGGECTAVCGDLKLTASSVPIIGADAAADTALDDAVKRYPAEWKRQLVSDGRVKRQPTITRLVDPGGAVHAVLVVDRSFVNAMLVTCSSVSSSTVPEDRCQLLATAYAHGPMDSYGRAKRAVYERGGTLDENGDGKPETIITVDGGLTTTKRIGDKCAECVLVSSAIGIILHRIDRNRDGRVDSEDRIDIENGVRMETHEEDDNYDGVFDQRTVSTYDPTLPQGKQMHVVWQKLVTGADGKSEWKTLNERTWNGVEE